MTRKRFWHTIQSFAVVGGLSVLLCGCHREDRSPDVVSRSPLLPSRPLSRGAGISNGMSARAVHQRGAALRQERKRLQEQTH